MKIATKKVPKKRRLPRKKPARGTRLDRQQLRQALGRLDQADLLDFLDEIMALVPDSELRDIGCRYVDLPQGLTSANLLAEVRSFDAASRAGDFYEDFAVNSRNFSELSSGTQCWIDECERLYRRIVAELPKLPPEDTREMLGLIIGLLHEVDDDNDIAFWADEGGSWQVGIDWKELVTYWLKALAATAAPTDYARAVTDAINKFYGEERERYFRLARKHATPEQRRALVARSKP